MRRPWPANWTPWTSELAVIPALMQKGMQLDKHCMWLQNSTAFPFVLFIHFQQTFIKQLLCVTHLMDSRMNKDTALPLKKLIN